MRYSTNQHGAFFIQKNDKFTLIAVETPRLKPSTMEADGIDYPAAVGLWPGRPLHLPSGLCFQGWPAEGALHGPEHL